MSSLRNTRIRNYLRSQRNLEAQDEKLLLHVTRELETPRDIPWLKNMSAGLPNGSRARSLVLGVMRDQREAAENTNENTDI